MQESLQGKSWGQHISHSIFNHPDSILNSTQNPQREARKNEPFRIKRNKTSPPPVKSQIKQQPHALGSYFPFSHLHLAPTELLHFSLRSGSSYPKFAAKSPGTAGSSWKQGWITNWQIFYSAATFPRTNLCRSQWQWEMLSVTEEEWKPAVVGRQQSQQGSKGLCLDDFLYLDDTNQGWRLWGCLARVFPGMVYGVRAHCRNKWGGKCSCAWLEVQIHVWGGM